MTTTTSTVYKYTLLNVSIHKNKCIYIAGARGTRGLKNVELDLSDIWYNNWRMWEGANLPYETIQKLALLLLETVSSRSIRV